MSDFNASQFFKSLNENDNFFYTLTEVIKSGNNQLAQKRYAESMVIDDSWIENIDFHLYQIEKIVKKPKLFIRDEDVIVPVELARKTGPETIRHLAANSNFIRSIDESGNVVPIKVLTKEMHEDESIYENRVVFTLINRLSDFIDQKYIAISAQVDSYDTTALELGSDFQLADSKIAFNFTLSIKDRAKINLVQKKNYELLEKLENIRKRLIIIKATSFYKALTSSKPIMPPIMKTNIFKMDNDYKGVYSLWLFISSFTQVGFSVQLDEKSQPIDSDYYDDLTALVAISLKTVIENNAERADIYRKIPFKKRKAKKFKIKKTQQLDMHFSPDKILSSEAQINQYYYEQIKKLVRQAEEQSLKNSQLEVKKKKSVSFRSFFTQMNNLNNSIYKEILKITDFDNKIELSKGDVLTRYELEYKKQSEYYKKFQTLSRLKLQDLDKALKEESRELVKLERLKTRLDEAKAKKTGRKPRKVSQKSLQNLKNSKSKLVEDATFREMQMLSDLRAKQALRAQKEQEKAALKKRKKAGLTFDSTNVKENKQLFSDLENE